MGFSPGTIAASLKAWVEARAGERALLDSKVLVGSTTVPADTSAAIHEVTASLLSALLQAEAVTPDALISAFFITPLTADHPARAARERLGWHSVPMLCLQEAPPATDEQDNLAIVLLAQSGNTPAASTQPPLRGMRGALILDALSEQQMQNGLRWLLAQSLARNNLQPDEILGAILTLTPDLDAATAQTHARALLAPSIPLLILPELNVPHAPPACIRTLLLARMTSLPQPVYSERALRLLRPDLLQPARPHPEPSLPPATITLSPSGPLSGAIALPGSKYHTLRAILAALLADGESTIQAPAQSDDTDVLLRACTKLGSAVQSHQHPDGRLVLSIQGVGGHIQPKAPLTLEMGNAGAVLRLLLGICATSPEAITFTTPHPASLGRRPNADLLHSLAQLGARITQQGPRGVLPITLQRGALRGGRVRLSGQQSSQFVSALLYLGPLLEDGLEIEITDTLASASFVDLTIQMLQQAGISVITKARHKHYLIPGRQRYTPFNLRIPGDVPSAAALLAAVAIAGGEVTLRGLAPDDPGASTMLAAFEQMGLEISSSGQNGEALTARAQGPLRGLTLDGSQVIDSVPCLAAAACFATTPSRIFNVANLRLKESDRLYDLAAALGALGCLITPSDDALVINPAPSIAGGVTVDAHNDHRLAQALAVAALACQHPVTLQGAQHIAKSYPRFFDDLASLGARICSASS